MIVRKLRGGDIGGEARARATPFPAHARAPSSLFTPHTTDLCCLQTSADDLKAGVTDPDTFFNQIVDSFAETAPHIAKKLIVGLARPMLEPRLQTIDVEWEAAVHAFDQLQTPDEAKEAVSSEDRFFQVCTRMCCRRISWIWNDVMPQPRGGREMHAIRPPALL